MEQKYKMPIMCQITGRDIQETDSKRISIFSLTFFF